MIYFLAVLIALAIGVLFGIQPSINAALGDTLEHPLQASLISFLAGTGSIFACCVATGYFPLRFNTPPSQLPWWIWAGGVIGAVIVTSSLIMVPRIGSLLWFAAVITGQILTATALDHFGWLGNPRITASPLRLFGAGLLLAGLLVIVGAKSFESGPLQDSNESFPPKPSSDSPQPGPQKVD